MRLRVGHSRRGASSTLVEGKPASHRRPARRACLGRLDLDVEQVAEGTGCSRALPEARSCLARRDLRRSSASRRVGRTSTRPSADCVLPPTDDLEEVFGLVGGSIFHGEPALDQLGFLRPAPLLSRYATPIEGLYLCGSGSHPGGGVTGAPGHNAARRVLRDRRREAWGRRVRAVP